MPTPTAIASETVDPSEISTASVDRSRRFVARVRAQGTGAARFLWEGEQQISLTRVGRPDLQVNMLSIGFMGPERLPEDPAARFRWAFDLLDTYQDTPATFTIAPRPPGETSAVSQAFLIWMRVKDSAKDKPAVFDMAEVEFLKEFNQLREPCTLELGEMERTGTLACPALATADGEVAGLTVSWEQTGEDLPFE